MTNEKDKALALETFRGWTRTGVTFQAYHPNGVHKMRADLERDIVDRITSAFATVRAEEREAAFKILCIDCAEGDVPTLDKEAQWFYHDKGTDAEVGCSASKFRFEAGVTENRKAEG